MKGVLIGGFALIAAPVEYCIAGMKTFVTGNKGVVCEKDFGPSALDKFKKMEICNPDKL